MDLNKTFEKLKKYFFEYENKASILTGNIYFLLIGVDEYKIEHPLKFGENDSEFLFNLWHTKSRFNIKNKNVYRLYNHNATKLNIVTRLKELSKNLESNDQLIIHFSGHGFNKLECEFFVPFDGHRENIYSCISNVYLNSYIKNLNAANVLFFVNTWNTFPDSTDKKFQEKIKDFIKNETRKEIKKNPSIYDELIRFLAVDNIQRNKEIFWFSRKPMERIIRNDAAIGEWKINDKELKKEIRITKKRIKKLLSEGDIKKALVSIDEIVENNDPKLDSQVDTLMYKLEEMHTIEEKTRKAVKTQETEKEITSLSSGIVNQVDNNGFYLINLPENQRSGEVRKKRTIILFTCADPSDQSRLRLNDEFRNIEYELMRAKNRDDFELIPCLASRIGDFQRKLLDVRPQIIHFSGHGENEGICLIGDEYGSTDIIENEPLAELFRLFSKDIYCVFLNSCHSVNQSELLSSHIDHVICMNNSVNDRTAIHFASSFYAALTSGQDVPFSFDFAKNSIDLHKLSGSEIPQLLTKNN